MRLLKQSSTAQVLTFLMVDDTDHVTPKTGLSPTVTISKAGGSFASPAGAVSEIGNGWYKVAGNATDTDTLGSLILHATGADADPADREYAVVAFDPQSATNLGLSGLSTANPGAAGGLLIAGSNAATTFATLTSTGAFSINGVSNVAQTGDSYAIANSGTHGNAALLAAIGIPLRIGTTYQWVSDAGSKNVSVNAIS